MNNAYLTNGSRPNDLYSHTFDGTNRFCEESDPNSAQNGVSKMGFVTKPSLGNGIRHKTQLGTWDSSQNLVWGMGFVTKHSLRHGSRHKT